MSAVARTALPAGLTDEPVPLDERTLTLLERRRRNSHRRGWLVRRMLLAADVVGLSLAFIAAEALFGGGAGVDRFWETVLFFTTTLPGWVVAAKIYGLYDRDEERASTTTTDDLGGVFQLVTLGVWLFFVGARLTGIADPELGKLVTFWALAVALVTLGRVTARSFCRRRISYLQNTVIVGAGEVGQLVARKVLQHPEYGIQLLGFVDAEPLERPDVLRDVPVLGPPGLLPSLVDRLDVERVIVAFSTGSHEASLELVRRLRELDVRVDVVPRFFEIVGRSVAVHTLEGLALMALPPLRLARSSLLLKRAMDVAVSLAGLVLLAPLFALVAILIKVDSRGPVFFRQVRMGSRGQTFRIVKFRTMVTGADARKLEFAHLNKHAAPGGDPRMFKIPADPRVTRIGRLLRRLSIDEVPQLVNVLRGQMSLVGPRPLVLDEDCHVADWARRRLDLKPGMTGLWQVLGRSDIPFEEMLRLDYVYVTDWSLWSDVRLILRTLPALARGAY
jgi:exopolysaccharide biosynthesis polyprenyl glycosylphosphotransferase